MEYPTEDEKKRLQFLAGQLKGSDTRKRKTIYEEMIEITEPHITKAYIE